MKRITVGRSTDCDIVIIDETDNVSRHHLVITFDFFGKMKVSDTSSNGTLINGTRMLKGTSIPVTTKDKIRLGRNTDLDWNLVKDPYRPLRMGILYLLGVLIVAGVVLGGWGWYKDSKRAENTPGVEVISTGIEMDNNWNQDSTAKVAPTITSIDVKDKKKSNSQPTDRKKKEIKKVSKPKEQVTTNNLEKGSDLDSIAVF